MLDWGANPVIGRSVVPSRIPSVCVSSVLGQDTEPQIPQVTALSVWVYVSMVSAPDEQVAPCSVWMCERLNVTSVEALWEVGRLEKILYKCKFISQWVKIKDSAHAHLYRRNIKPVEQCFKSFWTAMKVYGAEEDQYLAIKTKLVGQFIVGFGLFWIYRQ